MELHLPATVAFLIVAMAVGQPIGYPRGPQLYPCLTLIERNLRVDCDFPRTSPVPPGPFCEFKQDSRLMGSTLPNAQPVPELKRRSNVTLVDPYKCRLTYARVQGSFDEKAYTYTCRVIQGTQALENSMALHQRNVPVCSALSVLFHGAPSLLLTVMPLPVILRLLSA
ncbi:hypothetical protein SKAU_G00330270 [Synaphobranchus kaupii]|uniref:Thy-1 membrane glycoprotein n=1 Tax=Synaphobranchus kaupii TaxID=118154 RepID=A0A9Q1EQJ8_SYNKA|nr:hypothetical protein SKAU_G00330270 [Synaphobranchus kaupii]